MIRLTLIILSVTFSTFAGIVSQNATNSQNAKVLWGNGCPVSCTCVSRSLESVPLRKALETHLQHLELDDPLLLNTLNVRHAACVVISENFEMTLASIPKNVQTLNLLQGADRDVIRISHELLAPFKDLIALDVVAYDETWMELESNALREMTNLRLLGLNGVHIQGAVDGSVETEIITRMPPKHTRRRHPPWTYQHTDNLSEETPELVFLKPAEVVSFPRYSELRRESELKTFSHLQNLVMLRLHNAGLVDLAWEMFDGMENLQVLSLEYNGLAVVADWALYGAPKLRRLSLAHNELFDVSSTALVGLLELRSLDLSYNNISHLSELSLPPFPNLTYADFRENPIQNIFTNTFQIMNATETLLIGDSHTPLRLHADVFAGLRALKKLSVSDVLADYLDKDYLRGMPRLRDLFLKGSIPILPFDSFAEVPKLERLVLRCEVRTVSMDTFYGLFILKELDLSYNRLQSLPPNVFDELPNLRELLLNNNQLMELPPLLLSDLPAKMVRLDGNPWTCSCDMAGWQPTAINKVKETGRYVYSRAVSPICELPSEYRGWSVFDAMRRGFRCGKNPSTRLQPKLNAVPLLANPGMPESDSLVRALPTTRTATTVTSTETPDMTSDPTGTSESTTAESSRMTSTTRDSSQSPSSPSSLGTVSPTNSVGNSTALREGPTGDGRYILLVRGNPVFVTRKAYKFEMQNRRKKRAQRRSTTVPS